MKMKRTRSAMEAVIGRNASCECSVTAMEQLVRVEYTYLYPNVL